MIVQELLVALGVGAVVVPIIVFGIAFPWGELKQRTGMSSESNVAIAPSAPKVQLGLSGATQKLVSHQKHRAIEMLVTESNAEKHLVDMYVLVRSHRWDAEYRQGLMAELNKFAERTTSNMGLSKYEFRMPITTYSNRVGSTASRAEENLQLQHMVKAA